MRVLEEGSEGSGAQENALHDVLNIEREAQAIIADAEAQADKMVADARRRAQELQARAEREAQTESAESIQTALRYAEQATRAVRLRAEREMAAWEAAARERLDAVVRWVVGVITLTEEPEDDGAGA